jgi:hypothetical protein
MLVATLRQHGGRAVPAVFVDGSYAVIQVAPGNPSAIHKTAILNDAQMVAPAFLDNPIHQGEVVLALLGFE